jgi:hypothetical protein
MKGICQNCDNNSVEMPTRCSFVMECIIPKFIEGSIYFDRHTAHHQELYTLFATSGLYNHVVTGRCHSALATAGHHMSI